MAYHRVHKIDTRIIRIFNTYGPRMRKEDGRAIPNFLSQALQNKPLTVYGDGSQTRSFCFISDLIEGIVRLAEADYNEPVNLGNPQELSILKLAQVIIKLVGSSSQIAFQDLPVDDPKVRQPDITRASKLFNWKPKVKLEAGLESTIAYFKNTP